MPTVDRAYDESLVQRAVAESRAREESGLDGRVRDTGACRPERKLVSVRDATHQIEMRR